MFFSIFEERVSAYMLVLCMSYRVFNKSIYLFIFGLDTALCIDTVKSKFDQGGTVYVL